MSFSPETFEKLKTLRLSAVADWLSAFPVHCLQSTAEIESWLNDLLDIQIKKNQENAFSRNLRAAKLRWPEATFHTSKKLFEILDRSLVKQLETCNWLKSKTNILLSGQTSSGKTHIGCAIGHEAMLQGFKVRFFRFRELLILLMAADNENKLIELIKKMLRIDVIIIDDWTIHKLSRQEQYVLFELVEKREGRGSFVITTQFDAAAVHESVGGDAIADAILSRIVPLSMIINLVHDFDFRQLKMNAYTGSKKRRSK